MSSVDVFISYSTKDHVAAEAVVAHVERAGLKAWFAPRDVPVGTAYGEAIIQAIDGARALVLLLSSHSNASEQVAREVEHADKKRLPIFPLRLEDVMPQGSLEYFVSSVQFLDAFPEPLAPHLDRLVDGVRAKLSAQPSHAPSSAPAHSSGAPPSRSRTPLLIGVAAAFALVGAACAFMIRGKPAPDPPPVVLSFDYPLRGTGKTVVSASPYFEKFGITIVDVSAQTQVNLVDKTSIYNGTALCVDGGAPDVLVQALQTSPVSYTLVFAQPMKRVVLRRAALASVDAPDWSAHALSSDGRELAATGEQPQSGPAVASERALEDPTGAGIYRVRVESNHQQSGSINAIVLDGLTLYPMRVAAK